MRNALLDTWLISQIYRNVRDDIRNPVFEAIMDAIANKSWAFPAHTTIAHEIANIKPITEWLKYRKFYFALTGDATYILQNKERVFDFLKDFSKYLNMESDEIILPESRWHNFTNGVSWSNGNSVLSNAYPGIDIFGAKASYRNLVERNWSKRNQPKSQILLEESDAVLSCLRDYVNFNQESLPDNSRLIGPAGSYLKQECNDILTALISLSIVVFKGDSELAIGEVKKYINQVDSKNIQSEYLRSAVYSILYDGVKGNGDHSEKSLNKMRNDLSDTEILVSAIRFSDVAVLDRKFKGIYLKFKSQYRFEREVTILGPNDLEYLVEILRT